MDVPARLARLPDARIYLSTGPGGTPGPSCSNHPLPGLLVNGQSSYHNASHSLTRRGRVTGDG